MTGWNAKLATISDWYMLRSDERRAPLFGQRVGLPEHAAVDRFGVLVQRVSRFGDDRRHVGPEPPSCEELLKLVPSEKSYIRVRGGLSNPCWKPADDTTRPVFAPLSPTTVRNP